MKRPKPPSIITVAVITTITIVFWIFFSVYQILTGDVDVDIPEELLKPINPTLNQELLNKINQGQAFQKDEVVHFTADVDNSNNSNVQIEGEGGQDISPTPTPIISDSETENATQSGETAEQ